MKNGPQSPFIVPLFLPHAGCSHRCIFCNQNAIAGAARPKSTVELEHVINRYLGYSADRPAEVQIAFYGGNFLGLPDKQVTLLLAMAQQYIRDGRADSIRFSTRPDTIDAHHLELISQYTVRTVELGAQSMNERVLALSHRGHTAVQTTQAVRLLKDKGYTVGLQMMVGLPGDAFHSALQTARRLADLEPELVRIYPAVVLANSRLADDFHCGRYRPLSLQEAVQMVKRIYLLFFCRRIPVVRMGLQASTELESGERILAGPYHPAFGHLVHAALFLDMGRRLLSAGDRCGQTALFHTHPSSVAKMIGLRGENVAILSRDFALRDMKVAPVPDLPQDGLTLDGCGTVFTYETLMAHEAITMNENDAPEAE